MVDLDITKNFWTRVQAVTATALQGLDTKVKAA
jgi:hypothetical protein